LGKLLRGLSGLVEGLDDIASALNGKLNANVARHLLHQSIREKFPHEVSHLGGR